MALFPGLSALFETLPAANRMSYLMSLSDRELNARGLDRETLKRGFIEGLGHR